MGSDQSSLPAGAPGSRIRSQRDEEIPYTQFSISKPIDGDSPRQSPRAQNRHKVVLKPDRVGTPKHDIVVVTEGQIPEKDPDPELTKLNAIPVFLPILRGSLNVPTSSRDLDMLDKMDYRQLLLLCLRYQEHLKQLSEAVAFDQNALCIRIKEIDHTIYVLNLALAERQRRYAKFTEQFSRISETVAVLKKIKARVGDIGPRMDNLNRMLPSSEQLEPFCMKMRKSTIP
ncbi:BLOC-1-related complex subunit 5-like [Gigantopelta aegis]|uniref:BLOC-1-related complex subunit 5-like n=1 Tax=Gigantopelta aegis TaxID=1735272 RepID=UPI001B88931B|nr:BLOC-1-related complex subunit 5-like [Gigantopelta aegis]XP_041354242.1 BLOC-1-related complex subunit 5-like [Gigantopelta aegis]